MASHTAFTMELNAVGLIPVLYFWYLILLVRLAPAGPGLEASPTRVAV